MILASFTMSGSNKKMKSCKDVSNFMMQSRINTSNISLEGNGQALISFSTIDDREKAFSKTTESWSCFESLP